MPLLDFTLFKYFQVSCEKKQQQNFGEVLMRPFDFQKVLNIKILLY